MIQLLMILAHPLTPLMHLAVSVYFNSESLPISSEVISQVTTERVLLHEQAGRHLQGTSADWIPVITQWIGQVMAGVIIWVVVGFVYKSSITAKRPSWPSVVPQDWNLENKGWRYTTFQCLDHFPTCLYGWCCMPERLGDNFAAAGIGPFWTYVVAWLTMYIVAQALNLLTVILVVELDLDVNLMRAGNLCYWIAQMFLAYWLATKRQQLRQKLGDKSPNPLCMDFVSYWCCGCCTIIQDGRQIDGATNTRTECVCKLELLQPCKLELLQPAAGTVVVGQPVIVGNVGS